jgi:hypothetical protein
MLRLLSSQGYSPCNRADQIIVIPHFIEPRQLTGLADLLAKQAAGGHASLLG